MKPGRRTILLSVVFVAALALAFVFGYRARHWARMIRWQNEPIRVWMTVPFIAHAHHVSAEVLYRAIGVDPRSRDRRPLRWLARQQKRPVEELIKQLTAAVQQNNSQPSQPPARSPAEPPTRP